MRMKIFDIVKHEKKKATERCNKIQNMKKLMKVFEITLVILLLYWSTKKIPLAIRFPSKLLEISDYFLNPHLVFLIGNAIIFTVFLLCKQNGPENSCVHSDLYEVYSPPASKVALTSRDEPKPRVSIVASEVPLTSTEEAKTPVSIVASEAKTHVSIVGTESVECEVAIAAAEQEIRRFERTFSERLKREIAVRPRKELRRSETEKLRPVDHLSNEEFNLAIDAFIHKHRVVSKERVIE